MTKYVLYVNVADMPVTMAEKYVAQLKDTTEKALIEPGDKLLVLGVKVGYTRLEVIQTN